MAATFSSSSSSVITAAGLGRRSFLTGLGLANAGLGAGCARRGKDDALTIGYLPNLTHAQALVGCQSGSWAKALGDIRTIAFVAGPAAMEALFAGTLDVAFAGPSAVVNGFIRGKRIRVLAGAAAGGASLIARKGLGIRSPQDLRGRMVAAPQIGSSPDVALRSWLLRNGVPTTDRGGDVQVLPLSNGDSFHLLRRGKLDAAWVPEPWASRMVLEGGCERVLDERDLWDGGVFPTTVMVSSVEAMERAGDRIEKLVDLLKTETAAMKEPSAARRANAALEKAVTKPLSPAVLAESWSRLTFTNDPMPAALQVVAENMGKIGYLPAEPGTTGLVASSDELRRFASKALAT
jgi:NitT/TauT family transport system substrate-binding protein